MVFHSFDMQYRSQSMVKIYVKYGKCQGLSLHEMAVFEPDCARALARCRIVLWDSFAG